MSPTTLRRMGLLTSLYVSQGLPFGFFTQALPVLLRKRGLSLGEIGLSSLLALPWALKFVWAPLVDRFSFARIGRRRSWILPMQLLTVLLLAAVALSPPQRSLRWVMLAVLGVNFLSATQDIATDGLAVDMLAAPERGLANGIQVAGYRAGMILSGGALLFAFEWLGWTRTFFVMAGLVALTTVPILLHTEARPLAPETSLAAAATGFWRRPGTFRVLALLVIYKLGDAFATGMLRPFLTDLGLSFADIGLLVGTVGFLAGLLGALVGGALVTPIGRRRALVAFALLQAVSVLLYAAVAFVRPQMPTLYVVTAFEHFAGGMATAALFTCMMDWTEPASAATDYTIQASAVVVATGAAASLSGFSAERLGYPVHFAVAGLVAFVAPVAVYTLFPPALEPLYAQPA